ncbi:MAG TPA: hypothetical protein VGG48_09155 [Rhizomicrobium sp.]|jgi:hypothetical protein
MSDFLTNILGRAESKPIRPRLPSMFENTAAPITSTERAPVVEMNVEHEAPAPAAATRAPTPQQPARSVRATPPPHEDAPPFETNVTTRRSVQPRDDPPPPAPPAPQQFASPIGPTPRPRVEETDAEVPATPITPRPAATQPLKPETTPPAFEAPRQTVKETHERETVRVFENTETTTTRIVESKADPIAPALPPQPAPFAPPPPMAQPRQEARREEPTHQTAVAAEPTIHVTIGRIEIRATEERETRPRRDVAPSPVMTLDEYLKSRGSR